MESNPEGLKHRELTEKIIGVFYDVYNELGHGFLETIYEQALAIALAQAGMKVERQVAVSVWFAVGRSEIFAPICGSMGKCCLSSKPLAHRSGA
jgi:hypothetical protein